MPAVSQRAKGWQSLRAPQRGVAEPEPVMLARHPDIAIKNRAVTRERGCASCERAGSWSVRVRWGRGCTECSAGVLRVGLWMSVDFFGRTCCRGPKIRLQLRSSLATSAKKVFGKQRLTSLVNVSFPAPSWTKSARAHMAPSGAPFACGAPRIQNVSSPMRHDSQDRPAFGELTARDPWLVSPSFRASHRCLGLGLRQAGTVAGQHLENVIHRSRVHRDPAVAPDVPTVNPILPSGHSGMKIVRTVRNLRIAWKRSF